MKAYILSVVGMILVSVIVEMILPEGKLGSYVRSTISIFLFFVIVSPIVKLTKNGASSFDKIGVEIQQEFLTGTTTAQIDSQKMRVKNSLKNNFGIDTDVEICWKNESGVICVCGAEIWVLKSSESLHTDKVQEIANHVAALLKIEKEQVNVYV